MRQVEAKWRQKCISQPLWCYQGYLGGVLAPGDHRAVQLIQSTSPTRRKKRVWLLQCQSKMQDHMQHEKKHNGDRTAGVLDTAFMPPGGKEGGRSGSGRIDGTAI